MDSPIEPRSAVVSATLTTSKCRAEQKAQSFPLTVFRLHLARDLRLDASEESLTDPQEARANNAAWENYYTTPPQPTTGSTAGAPSATKAC